MITKKEYKDFSLDAHARSSPAPVACQLELTFGCPLRCVHCYTNCYNNEKAIERELDTASVKKLLDKIHAEGCIWLCLTGGEPLSRNDFSEIYLYAKRKGFLITIFTNAVLFNEQVARVFREYPPFSIEVTLNGTDTETYESISKVRGSYKMAMRGIRLITDNGLPLKIKTLITKFNKEKMSELRHLITGMGKEFLPSSAIYPSLDGSTKVCSYRLEPAEAVKMEGRRVDCEDKDLFQKGPDKLFRCATGGFSFHIDPYGKMFLCEFLRNPSYDILNGSIKEGFTNLKDIVRRKKFSKDSKCRDCKIWFLCDTCPARAYLETGSEEAPVKYLCELAHLRARGPVHEKDSNIRV